MYIIAAAIAATVPISIIIHLFVRITELEKDVKALQKKTRYIV